MVRQMWLLWAPRKRTFLIHPGFSHLSTALSALRRREDHSLDNDHHVVRIIHAVLVHTLSEARQSLLRIFRHVSSTDCNEKQHTERTLQFFSHKFFSSLLCVSDGARINRQYGLFYLFFFVILLLYNPHSHSHTSSFDDRAQSVKMTILYKWRIDVTDIYPVRERRKSR